METDEVRQEEKERIDQAEIYLEHDGLTEFLEKFLPDIDNVVEQLRQDRLILEIEDLVRELWKLEGDKNW